MRNLLLGLAFLALALAFTPFGASAQPQCDTRENVIDLLRQKYKEEPVALGVTHDGDLVEVLSTGNGTTWSIIVTTPQGTSCLVVYGEGWRAMEQVAQDPEASYERKGWGGIDWWGEIISAAAESPTITMSINAFCTASVDNIAAMRGLFEHYDLPAYNALMEAGTGCVDLRRTAAVAAEIDPSRLATDPFTDFRGHCVFLPLFELAGQTVFTWTSSWLWRADNSMPGCESK